MIRDRLRDILEQRAGWKVVGEARNGREAVEAWHTHKPNITVMDLQMPEMNGLEAARRLTDEVPDAPILMVTLDPSKQLEEEAQKAGIKGLCSKLQIQRLQEAVEALLKGETYFHRRYAA